MKKFKFRTVQILIFIICLIFVANVFVIPFMYFSYVSKWKYKVEDFEMYKNDFESIVELTKYYFEKSDDTNKLISVGYDVNTKKYKLWYDGTSLQLTNEQQQSLNRIVKNAFPCDLDSNFDRITCYGEYIFFGIDNGQYAVVYSSNDSRPTFLIKPDENVAYDIKKIEKYWYHIVCD